MKNTLWFGDCLTIMRDNMNLGSVDLIYLDPPFNSNRAYNAIYKDATGRPLPDQIDAFCDMWTLDAQREDAIRFMPVLLRQAGIDDSAARLWQLWMNALRGTQPRLLAYLSYMTERLVQMKPILKPTGSIYLHCDPTASHYIKIIMDAIFGHENFRNEITWQRTESHNTAERYGNVADILLYYSKSDKPTWNPQYQPYGDAQMGRFRHVDASGRRYKLDDLTAPRPNSDSGKFEWRGTKPGATRGWGYKIEHLEAWWANGRIQTKRDGTPRMDGLKVYLDEAEGKPLQNVWVDVHRIPNTSSERLGYDTQKPLALLERIIRASTNEGDTVLDPFCGCATTLEAAHNLNRKWIGIDIAYHAIKHVVMPRLQDRLRLIEGTDFVVDGVPSTFEAAQDLWTRDKYHFQSWAISIVDGLPTNKRTADGGIDGRLHFASPNVTSEQSMALEVKGGRNVSIGDLRALRGVLEADEAWMAGLIILHPLGVVKKRNFQRFMAQAGQADVFGMTFPRMQMLTVQEILDGKRFHAPSGVARGTGQGVLISD